MIQVIEYQQKHLIRFTEMSNQQEIEVYQYNLNIIAITMKIKFPCKMHIQFNNSPITTEVTPSNNNKFIFNQQITLKEDPDKQYFELVVHLTTDKGAKYIGGVIKMLSNELMNSEGQRLNVPLIKCLDNDACCELRVDQVSTSRIIAKSKFKPRPMGSEYNPEFKSKSPVNNKPQQFSGVGGARSEFYFPLTNNNNRKNDWDRKSRQMPQLSYIPKRRSPSKIYQGKQTNTFDDQISFQGGSGTPTNLLQAEVYKQGYQKLKQKYKKQVEAAKTELNKRIQLENNQNNYKLEIMRLKLKSQQQEKSLTEKTSKITQLQNQLVSLQKKETDLNYMKEESVNKDHQIRVLEQTIKTLQKDNNQLKLLNNSRFASDQEKINQLKDEIYTLKLTFEQKQTQLTRDLKQKIEIIEKKNQQIIAKNELIERQRYSVEDLERSSQNKIFEFEKVLQNQRALLNQKILQQREKRLKVQAEKSKLEDKIKQLTGQIEKSKVHINKIQYDKKILTQSGDSMKSELQEFRQYKQKYIELSREFKFLSDDKNHLEKQLQKTIQSKDINLSELSKQHGSQLQYYKKINRQLDEKSKQQSSKIIELESQLEMTKNQLEKNKRNCTTLEKDLNDSRNKEKQLKQTLKSRDEQILALQTQLSAAEQNLKSSQQTLKLELQKTKDQLQKTKTQLQSQKLKNNQLNEINTALNNQVTKLKMKCQFLEEKSEKQQSNLNDRITNLETQLKDTENQLNNTTLNLAASKLSQKQLLQKIKNQDIANISTNETIEKLKKEIKILQERQNNSEIQIKSKVNEINQLNNGKQNLDKKLQQRQSEVTSLKAEINKLLGEKNKNQKIIEMLQNDLTKAKEENGQKTKTITDKEGRQEQLRDQVKKGKEDNTKMEMKYTSLKKQFQKFKQNLIENITNSFAQLPVVDVSLQSSSTNYVRKSFVQIPQENNKLSTSTLIMKKSTTDPNSTDIISLILSNTKDAKINLTKLIEQNKQLVRENQRLSQDMNSTNKKAMNNEQALSQQIQQLQEQLANLQASKEEEIIKSDDEIFKMNTRLRQKQSNIKDLTMQVQQLQFTLSNIKLDLEATHEDAVKKQSMMKKEIIELKEQIEFQLSEIGNLQDHIEKMQEEIFVTTTELQTQKDNLNKRDFKINQLLETKEKLQNQIDQFKRQKKLSMEKISELELMLNSEKELKQKHLSLLEEEEVKNKELKAFIDNLMKQKEGAIKSQLEKSEQIINLQSSIIEIQRERDIIKEQNEKNKKIIQQLKEQVKKLNKNLKDIDSQLSDQKTASNKISEKLKEKEKELNIKVDQLSKLEEKYKKQTQKTTKELTELQGQMDEKYTAHLISEKQNNQKILSLQKEVNRLQALVEKQRSEITQYEEFIFAGKQKNQELTEANKAYEQEIAQLKQKIQLLDSSNNDISEQVREKQESLFQMSGKIYNLQQKIEAQQVQKQEKLQSLNTEWQMKYDSMLDEYDHKIQLIEKEKEFTQQRLQEKEKEIQKILAQTKINESDGQNTKRAFQEKIKNLEDDRLSILSQKNNQIQRITQENKQNYQKLKEKQNLNRKISHELDVAKNTITKLDAKLKEGEQKMKNNNKAYQTELQQLKKKELNFKAFKESLTNNIWKSQRQVRKTVQYFVKNLLTVTDEKKMKVVVELTKALQNNIVNAMALKIDDKQVQKSE